MGGVAPRRNNRITESATKGKQGSESKSEEGDTRIKRKTTRRKDKSERKKNKEWDTENDKKERGKKTKKKRKENTTAGRLHETDHVVGLSYDVT